MENYISKHVHSEPDNFFVWFFGEQVSFLNYTGKFYRMNPKSIFCHIEWDCMQC